MALVSCALYVGARDDVRYLNPTEVHHLKQAIPTMLLEVAKVTRSLNDSISSGQLRSHPEVEHCGNDALFADWRWDVFTTVHAMG